MSMIEQALPSDATALARLHAVAIDKGFLVCLGHGFLKSLYSFLIKHEIVLVYRCEDGLKGFVSGSIRPDGMMLKFLILCPVCLIKLALKSTLHPTLFKSILETFKVPDKSKSNPQNRFGFRLPDTELLSIAVHPDYQQKQVGHELILSLEKHFDRIGIRRYKVIAVDSLKGANQFLLKNNFEYKTQINVHGKSLSNVYIKEISNIPQSKFKRQASIFNE